ncbi:hypothetical protein V1478_010966 [Vespula squamosa]|uniref:Uncharacterized protein n=1 Tax=Vespula squamosa TaxID=30214 RepID=A0ABD2AFZ2_VESSQ
MDACLPGHGLATAAAAALAKKVEEEVQDGPARIKNAITILKNGPGCSSRSSSPEDRFFVFRRSWDSRLSGIRSSMQYLLSKNVQRTLDKESSKKHSLMYKLYRNNGPTLFSF